MTFRARGAAFGDVRDAIEHEMAARRVPGVSAVIVEDAVVTWTGAFGERRDGGDAVTVDTVFEGASIGKPVFTWCVLDLVDRGLLQLDTPLVDYSDERFLPDDGIELITARMVLTHTSGLSWRVTGGEDEGGPYLKGKPGGDFRYSGVGFDYLAWVVERVTRRPTAEMMRDFMLSIGMGRSSYLWEPMFESNYASPHDLEHRARTKWKSDTFGSGYTGSALHTTAADLGSFLCRLVGSDVSPTHALVLEPHVDVHQEFPHGPPGPGASWGLGIGVWITGGERTFWHWGENPGFQSILLGWPARRSGIAVLTNSDNGQWVSRAACAALEGRDHPAFAWIEN